MKDTDSQQNPSKFSFQISKMRCIELHIQKWSDIATGKMVSLQPNKLATRALSMPQSFR